MQHTPPTDTRLDDIAARWNTRYPIGTPVTAYPGLLPADDRHTERLITRTRSEAQVLGGHTPVVWVDGHSACIALTHVVPVQSADTYVPPAKYIRSDGADCCPHGTPVGPGSCEACWDLVKWDARDTRVVADAPAPHAPSGPAGGAVSAPQPDSGHRDAQEAPSASGGRTDAPAAVSGGRAAVSATPRGELAAAAEHLRAATFRGAMTATPAVAGLIRAREPLALLLEAVASNSLEDGHEQCGPWCSPEFCVLSAALAVARALTP